MPSSDADTSGADIPARTTLHIDGGRLWNRLMTMAAIGRRGETGVDRPAFSLGDRAARRQLYEWGCEHGLEATQDSIGNLFLRLPGQKAELPPVLTGSHMDSQPSGGRFDGIYGVLAGLEALACLSGAGLRPLRSIEVVAWSNEEGGRFAPGAMGSQVFAGSRVLAELLNVQDESGTSLHEALSDTLAALPEAAVRRAGASPAAYVEAHIEQGPRLEKKGIAVGVVSGIQGCLWLEFEVSGVAGHAGTTPHEFRRDALQGAVRLIDELQNRCLRRSPNCRFTVGRLLVEPNTPNTIPGRVIFTVDFRDADPRLFDELCRMLREASAPGAFGLKIRELFHHPPVVFSAEMTRIVAAAASSHNHPVFELVSGAFHDALFITAVCPVGMVFIRCREGISHNPLEYAEPADVTAGAEVLLSTLLELSQK
jgi:beta-ureidopropionase / N-carbamoyl-L-amino-acid hydrolase